MEWINDKVLASFGRHEAPVMTLQDGLDPGEVVFIMSGLIPNRKSHPLVHRWFGVVFQGGKLSRVEEFSALMKRTGLGKIALPNPGAEVDTEMLRKLLPLAVDEAQSYMSQVRYEFKETMDRKLDEQVDRLGDLQQRQHAELEKRFSDTKPLDKLAKMRQEKERREIDRTFDEYVEWVKDTMETEKTAYIRVVAVLKGTA
ncbi:hypothetical protein ACFL2Q_13050 [Thermodesulfobacteriota bacterium]